jgi:hypothetical protein
LLIMSLSGVSRSLSCLMKDHAATQLAALNSGADIMSLFESLYIPRTSRFCSLIYHPERSDCCHPERSEGSACSFLVAESRSLATLGMTIIAALGMTHQAEKESRRSGREAVRRGSSTAFQRWGAVGFRTTTHH